MNILVIPDSFKGSLRSLDFCDVVKKSFDAYDEFLEIKCIPLADGGEGTIDVLNYAGCIKIRELLVEGPNSRPCLAKYGVGSNNEAIIEMAQASGMIAGINPLFSSTFGTGQLIMDAIKHGHKKVIVTLGGSGTNDGGAGMAQALGYQLVDKKGNEITKGGKALLHLHKIVEPVNCSFDDIDFVVACDVKNPLLGKFGASRVYGPQKRANPEDVTQLEKGLHQLNEIWKSSLGRDLKNVPGGGAAGGLGAGMMAFLNAKFSSGFELIDSMLRIEDAITSADVVITGEGSLDQQTLHGKLVDEVAALAKKHKKPLIIVAGKIDESVDWAATYSVHKTYALVDFSEKYEDSIKDAKHILRRTVEERIIPLIKNGRIND